jgi:hypothetical protein
MPSVPPFPSVSGTTDPGNAFKRTAVILKPFPWKSQMRVILACVAFVAVVNPAFAQKTTDQSVTVGPWSIVTTYKAEKFTNCTMTRSASDLGVMFIRNQDGLLLALDSPKWKLERGKAYTVRLSAGSQSIEAKALAESKSVTIALADRSFNEKLRTSNTLGVRGEGTTLQVPLDGSAAALERLDTCFEKNLRDTPEANPFVAPNRRP